MPTSSAADRALALHTATGLRRPGGKREFLVLGADTELRFSALLPFSNPGDELVRAISMGCRVDNVTSHLGNSDRTGRDHKHGSGGRAIGRGRGAGFGRLDLPASSQLLRGKSKWRTILVAGAP